ncbi:MAG TPA: hypothetical protein VHD36_07395 [Pirellulales bacterium]|nr:hypothetical protein [Pirellulales bacterium]
MSPTPHIRGRSFGTELALSAALLIGAYGCGEYRETPPPTATKAVRLRSQWPGRIIELVDDAGRNGIDLKSATVYQYITDEYYFESVDVPGLLDFLNDRWSLRQIGADEWAANRIRQRAPVGLIGESDWTYYVSDRYAPGQKGDSFILAVDDRKGKIVLRYYYNF